MKLGFYDKLDDWQQEMKLHKNFRDTICFWKTRNNIVIMQVGRETEFKAFAEICSMKTVKCVNGT